MWGRCDGRCGELEGLGGGRTKRGDCPDRCSSQRGSIMTERAARFRWCGGGVFELSSLDGRDMVFVDAWFWSNAGWAAFGVERPPEFSSPEGFVAHVQERNPETLLIAITHDHADHIDDYMLALRELIDAGVRVKSVIQSDLGRTGLREAFREAGVDPGDVLVYEGRGCNLGGELVLGSVRAWMVPALHSGPSGYPAVGYVLEVGGVRFYCSGDTDLFGDMALIGRRYRPDVAVVCVGNRHVTMGPDAAAEAVALVGARVAVPVHYGHNPRVRQSDAGPEFSRRVLERYPAVDVLLPLPGEVIEIALS